MTPRQVRKFCALKPESPAILKAAMQDLWMSARAQDKLLVSFRWVCKNRFA